MSAKRVKVLFIGGPLHGQVREHDEHTVRDLHTVIAYGGWRSNEWPLPEPVTYIITPCGVFGRTLWIGHIGPVQLLDSGPEVYEVMLSDTAREALES